MFWSIFSNQQKQIRFLESLHLAASLTFPDDSSEAKADDERKSDF